MHAPATLVRRKITYWQSQGLLHEIAPDSFELVEESGPRVKGHIPSDIVCDDEETESAMASAQEQREEELQVTIHLVICIYFRWFVICCIFLLALVALQF